jgi:hypothetical protein
MKKFILVVFTGFVVLSTIFISCWHDQKESILAVQGLKFSVDRRDMSVGERVTIGIAVNPPEARSGAKISYSMSSFGIVKIDEAASSADGAVLEAVSNGSSVLIARANGIVAYCDIMVEGGAISVIPHIVVTENVLEVPVGARRHVVANLQGGTPADHSGFTFLNNDHGVASIESANNTVVIEGIRSGMTRVQINHPKAQYGVDVLVFVLNEGETAKYLTADQNVVFMNMGDNVFNFYLRLVGFDEDTASTIIQRSVYQVVEGSAVVRVHGSGDSCTIQPLSTGIAKVRVSNQEVEHPFEFQVVVRARDKNCYIDIPDNLVILNHNDVYNFNARFVGDVPEDVINKYTYSLSEQGIVDVIQTQNYFTITAHKTGIAVMTIDNEYSDFPRELLIMVRTANGEITNNQTYISTSQNVIQMETESTAILTMQLVGGIESDRNLFEWVVEDSSIITAEVSHGIRRYQRATVDLASQGIFEAEALITSGKKVGTTTITVSNPKTSNVITVLIKVYSKGTFDNGKAITLGGPSLIKLQKGSMTEVYTPILGGKYENLGYVQWDIEDPSIARVEGTGLFGAVSANSSGITRLRVHGENIAGEHYALVVVYNEGEEDLIPYIFADNLYYRVSVGQTVHIGIQHPNIPYHEFSFNMINTNKNSIHTQIKGDIIMMSGLEPGEGELIIYGDGYNTLRIKVLVDYETTTLEKPYMLLGNNFAGVNVNGMKEYTVAMAGASQAELNKIYWSIDDTGVASITGSTGNSVMIKGHKKGQTVLRIGHTKSINTKEVIVFVVGEDEDISGKVVLGLERANYSLNRSQSLFLRLITNAGETQKLQIRWKLDDDSIVHIDDNYDSAVITALKSGNVKITAYMADNSHVMDLVIFITVYENMVDQVTIGFPSSIVVVKGQSKIVRGNVAGTNESSIKDLQWIMEDEGIVEYAPSGISLTVLGIARGQTFINVFSGMWAYSKKILVICVDSESELESLYYYAIDRTFYRIQKGDELRLNLVYGENGFPDEEKAAIEWKEVSGNGVVLIASQGGTATVVGKNAGSARIAVSSGLMAKPIEIIVEVSENASGSDSYMFMYTAIHQIGKINNVFQVLSIPVSIFTGSYINEDGELIYQTFSDTGYNLIEVSVADTRIAEAKIYGGAQNCMLRVEAFKPGRTEITLHHEQIKQDAKLLIVVYDGETPADDVIVYVPKTHYLLGKNEAQSVKVEIYNSALFAESDLMWDNHNLNAVTLDAGNKTNAVILGVSPGNAVIDIFYKGQLVGKVYVSVSDASIESQYIMATESIIILSKDEFCYITSIVINGYSGHVEWEAVDETVITVEPNWLSCDIFPKRPGVTDIKVRAGGLQKTIVVVVVATEAEKYARKYMNIDQRFFYLNKGEELSLSPYFKMQKTFTRSLLIPQFNNNVISVTEDGNNRFIIKGLNEGIEIVRFRNNDCGNWFDVTFQVSAELSGTVQENPNPVYLTTSSNVLVLEPGETDRYLPIGVIGEYLGNDSDFKWSKDSKLITMNPSGKYALVSAGKTEGVATIKIENVYCQAPIEVKIIIGDKYTFEYGDEPYIYVEKQVYTIKKSDAQGIAVYYELRNVDKPDYNASYIEYSDGVFNCGIAGQYIGINPKTSGTGTITIRNSQARYGVKLYIVVVDERENNAVYLTTSQNYIIVNKGATKLVTIDLVNYVELDSTKIMWASQNNNIAYVVGNGYTVQVYGYGEGITKLTARHIREGGAFNDLEIVVKVLPQGANEEICYLTTNDNVIETYISTNSTMIQVAKVGGQNTQINATWTVDDPTVVSVMGNNAIAYFTPKKAGIARVTVEDREAGPLKIVIIVKTAQPGSLYLYTEKPIVQLLPGSMNNVVSVTLVGGEESDNNQFKYEIYSQIPSDMSVARAGGSVIAIYAMGSRISVAGHYAGLARIRVTHPKAQDPLYIVVQVTEFFEMGFAEHSPLIVVGDMYFVGVQLPNYENLAGKVEYHTDNPNVCTVLGGTSSAILLSANAPGAAVVTATVPGYTQQARLEVMVLAEESFDDWIISTQKTTYVLSPRERPFLIEAFLQGVGTREQDRDNLQWEFGPGGEEMMNMYPPTKKGREVQIEVISKEYKEPRETYIRVTHPLTSRSRTIYVQIAEESNAFTLSKRDIRLESDEMAELSCAIAGGSNRDYDEVIWMVSGDKIDTTKKIVNVLGKGKNVQLFALNDGYCQITAIYRGLTATCNVDVYSSVYINIDYSTFLMYPGERFETKDAQGNGTGNYGEYPYINYKVRPASQPINWLNTDNDLTGRVCTTTFGDPDSNGNGKIMFNPLCEGDFTIMGSIPGRKAQVNVMIRNNYHMSFDGYYFERNPGGKGPASERPVDPNTRFIKINYTLSPPNAVLSLQDYSTAALNGFLIGTVRNSAGNDRSKATGVITIECTKDLDWQYASSGYPLLFELIQPDGNKANIIREVKIKSYFNMEDYHLVPVFERITGNYSNNADGRPNGPTFRDQYGYPNGSIKDGTLKYPVGAGIAVKGGEFITYTGNDIYHLCLSDGEEAYLLFDKINPNASISNLTLSYPGKDNNEDTRNGRGLRTQDQKQRLGPTYEEVTLANQGKALRISGGADFVLFSRFGSDYDLEVELSSDYTGIGETVYNPSATGWIDGTLRPDLAWSSFLNLCAVTKTESDQYHTSTTYSYTYNNGTRLTNSSFSIVTTSGTTTSISTVLSSLKNLGVITDYRYAGSQYLVTFYYATKNPAEAPGNVISTARTFESGTATYTVFGSSGSKIRYRDVIMTPGSAPTTLWYPLTDTYKNKETQRDNPVIKLEFFKTGWAEGDSPITRPPANGAISAYRVNPYIDENGINYFKANPDFYNTSSNVQENVSKFHSSIACYNFYRKEDIELDLFINFNGYSFNYGDFDFVKTGFKNIFTKTTADKERFHIWNSYQANTINFDLYAASNYSAAGKKFHNADWNGTLKAMDFMTRVDDIISYDTVNSWGLEIYEPNIQRYSGMVNKFYLNHIAYNSGSAQATQKTYIQFKTNGFVPNGRQNVSSFSKSFSNSQYEYPFGLDLSTNKWRYDSVLRNIYIKIMDLKKQRIDPNNPSLAKEDDNINWPYRFYPLGSKHTKEVYEYSPKVNKQHKVDNGADEIIITYNARGATQTIKIYVHYEIRQCSATHDPDASLFFREVSSWDDLDSVDINQLYNNYNGKGKDPDGSEINGSVMVAKNYWPIK